MRQRKLGSHTPPCHRRMVITTLFSVLHAALQRRPVLYHTRWLLAVHWHCSSGHQGQLAPTTHPQCRLVSNPCPAGREVVSNSILRGAMAPWLAQRRLRISACAPSVRETQQIIAVMRVAHTTSAPHDECACRPHIQAYLLSSSSHGPHSRRPSRALAVQHVTTCCARGSGALRRPDFSFLDCSVSPWRPFHLALLEPTLLSPNPGQLEPTTSLCAG